MRRKEDVGGRDKGGGGGWGFPEEGRGRMEKRRGGGARDRTMVRGRERG